MYIQCLQWLSAVRLHGCHQPVLASGYHVSTDSGRAILSYWGVLFISIVGIHHCSVCYYFDGNVS